MSRDPLDPVWDLPDAPTLVRDRAHALPTSSDPQDGQARQPNILLLDDDSHMLEVQTRMLRGMGYGQLTTAASARDALLQLERDPNAGDIIICDLRMPDMDGIEFLQALNATPFRGSVILLSGESERLMHSVHKLLGARQLNVLGTLTKPARRDALRSLLNCWRPRAGAAPAKPMPLVTAADVAVANNERQWTLHYQPKVDLLTGALFGMEALVRWNHPQHGLVYPDQFIAVAEESGAINGLTDWVIQEALQQRTRWLHEGLKLQMAVNVSALSLLAPNFWRHITDLVRDARTAPQDLALEITESRLAYSQSTPLENLVRLRLQRFTLSIDDFGTGHSSLAQLRDVPFTELKIDRGFVHGARDNQIIRPMLEGSIGIARRLGMRSVAEGVETETDWNLLRELDCDVAQGYFIGRPMRADQMWEWVNAWQARLPCLVGP